MGRRIDHTELNAKLRGLRDHAADPERERDREFAKRKEAKALKKWAAKFKAGKPPRTKVAKRSGPVRTLSPEEIAAIEADLKARGELVVAKAPAPPATNADSELLLKIRRRLKDDH